MLRSDHRVEKQEKKVYVVVLRVGCMLGGMSSNAIAAFAQIELIAEQSSHRKSLRDSLRLPGRRLQGCRVIPNLGKYQAWSVGEFDCRGGRKPTERTERAPGSSF